MGNITANEAEGLIGPLANRAFLVRFSSSSGEYSITFKQKGQVLHSRVPITAKYNLHQYVKLLQQRKKFGVTPNSPFKTLFDQASRSSVFQHNFIR